MGANMYIINTYGPIYGASAIAANRFSAYLFAAAFPLFATQSKFNQSFFSLQFVWFSSLSWLSGFSATLHIENTPQGLSKHIAKQSNSVFVTRSCLGQ